MIILAKKKEQTSLIYKNRPLVKRGDTVIYGDIADDYYICITVLESENYTWSLQQTLRLRLCPAQGS